MNNLYFINNVLPVDLILQIKNCVLDKKTEITNHSDWDQNIVQGSARVDIFTLATPFREQVINCYADYVDLKKYSFIYVSYYKWLPGSFIPFHNDNHYSLASTIYLNESWNIDYGGLFLYEKNKDIKAYVPKYNSAVINDNNVPHGTSIISPTAPKRETLQVFFK